jgi:hypothetical protein
MTGHTVRLIGGPDLVASTSGRVGPRGSSKRKERQYYYVRKLHGLFVCCCCVSQTKCADADANVDGRKNMSQRFVENTPTALFDLFVCQSRVTINQRAGIDLYYSRYVHGPQWLDTSSENDWAVSSTLAHQRNCAQQQDHQILLRTPAEHELPTALLRA